MNVLEPQHQVFHTNLLNQIDFSVGVIVQVWSAGVLQNKGWGWCNGNKGSIDVAVVPVTMVVVVTVKD